VVSACYRMMEEGENYDDYHYPPLPIYLFSTNKKVFLGSSSSLGWRALASR